MMIREQEQIHRSQDNEGVVSAAIKKIESLANMYTENNSEQHRLSQTNIEIDVVKFKEANQKTVSKNEFEIRNRLSANDSDFLSQLDAELRQTEENVKEMNERFNK